MPSLNGEAASNKAISVDHEFAYNISDNMTYLYEGPFIDVIERHQFMVLLPSFIYTATLMFFGLPGNFIVILVYYLKMTRTTSRHFIISLAVVDFINCAFGMPVELSFIHNYYNFDLPILCKVWRFCTFCMNNVSALVLLGIAVDRFRRVWLPLRPNMTVRHSKIICILAAIFGLISAIPALFIYGTRTIIFPTADNHTKIVLKTCYIMPSMAVTVYPLAFSIYLFIGTLAILFAICVMYAMVGKVVCGRKKLSEESFMFRPRVNSALKTHELNSNANGNGETDFSRRERFLSTRIWRSLSEHSPKLLRTSKSSPKLDKVPEITEPFAMRSRAHSDTSVRRHGGKEIRAGRTTTILFIVTLVFVLSFVPYLAIVLMRYIKPTMVQFLTPVELSIYNFTLRSYLMNSAVNPIIYCFLNRQFRMKVKIFFRPVFRCNR